MKDLVSRAEAAMDDRETIRRFQTAHTLTFEPVRQLTFKATLGLDYRTSEEKDIVGDDLLNIDTDIKSYIPAPTIFTTDRKYFGVTAELNGQWKLYHGDWLSNILTAGFQFFNTYDHQTALNGQGVHDGALVLSGAAVITGDEWLSKMHSTGLYVQDNLGLRSTYYLDLGLRVDDNSAFGSNVGVQAYPKVGLSYIMSEEGFMRQLAQGGLLTQLRLFANYGVAGSYPPAFAYQRTVSISSYQGSQAATFGNYGNDDLGPEKKHSLELGLNASLLRGRVNLALTYYYSRTKDALFNVPTLPSSGEQSTYLANVGDIMNKGIEIALDVTPVKTRLWTVNLAASLNTNHNEVISTGGVPTFGIGGFESSTIQTAVSEGEPVGYLRGNKAVLNDDGTLKEVLTGQNLGSTLPTMYGNIALTASYQRLTLFVNSSYQTGAYVHSFDAQFRFLRGLKDDNIPEAALGGQSQSSQWLNFTNFFVYKADFLKIRNISLSYTFPMRHFLRSIDAALNIYNPFCLTACPCDPEATLAGANTQGTATTSGINYTTYSQPRQYVLTLRLNF